MKFTTFLQNGRPRLGVLDGDAVIDLNAAQSKVPADLRAALEAGVDLAAAAKAAVASTATRIPLAGLAYAPLVPEPGKTICLGLNWGTGWRLVTRSSIGPIASLSGRAGWQALSVAELSEVDGVLAAWFHAHRCEAALVRPDHYVFGTAATAAEIPELLANAHERVR